MNSAFDAAGLIARLSRGREAFTPRWELEFHLWDRFAKAPVPFGKSFAALADREKREAVERNAEAMLGVAEDLGFSAVTVPGGYWETAPGEPVFFWLPDPHRLALTESLARKKPSRIVLVANIGGVLAMPDGARFVDFSLRLLEDPDSVEAEAERTLEAGLEQARRFIEAGVEAVCSPSDLADNRGLYFNLDQMERLILPFLKRWASGIRNLGAFPILHTDGNVSACLDDLADSGISALQAVDPLAGMDMKEVQDRSAGRIALAGNVDCGLLAAGKPEEVHAAVTDLLRSCGRNGNLVLGASNAVQAEVPPENYLALTEAWKEYCDHG